MRLSRYAVVGRFALFLASAGAAALVDAAPWISMGPADGGSAIVTHPAVAGQAMVSGASNASTLGTWFTSNGAALLMPNGIGAGGSDLASFLAGSPTIAYSSDATRSNDLGRTWAPFALPEPPAQTTNQIRAVNPLAANELVITAGSIVRQTVDAGVTWTSDVAPAPIAGLVVDWSTRRLYASFAPNQPLGNRPLDAPGAWNVGGQDPQVFAAGHGIVVYQTSAGALYRSTNGGATFVPVAQALGMLSLCDIEFAPGANARAYALECTTGRVLFSVDDGATWSMGATVAGPTYFSHLAIDSDDGERVYVSTSDGILASDDSAATFHPLDRSSGAPGKDSTLLLDATNSQLQWLATADKVRSFARTADGGASWEHVANTYRLIGASRGRSNTLFGAPTLSENGDSSFSVSTDGGTTWSPKITEVQRGHTFGPIAYGPVPGELYVFSRGGTFEGGFVQKLYFSDNDGESFVERFYPPVGVQVAALTQSAPPIFYAGGSAVNLGDPQLYRSVNGGVTWTPVAQFPAYLSSFGGAAGNRLTALAIDPTNPNRIYAGFDYPDYLMRSDDAGATWVRATKGLGAAGVTSIGIDPANTSILYAGTRGSGVFRSDDGGDNWVALDAGLKEGVIRAVEFDRFHAGRLYASTATGPYRTEQPQTFPVGYRRVIEFYHADFNHYFISADVDEIAGLDAGVFQGWARTGLGFKVAEATSPGNQPVCRFFGVGFAPLSSHFYTPYPNECEIVKADPKWQYEKIAFGLVLPDPPPERGCPPETWVLYRLYNNFSGGAPNHRYTTNYQTFQTMIGEGWIFEGELQTLVFACIPL